MEIRLDNFESKLGLICESIKDCEFVTFDTEFTGSKVTIEDKPHEFDTFQDKYRKNKSGITKFMVVQVGITTFNFCPLKKKYIGRPFNILVFPRSIVNEGHLTDQCKRKFHLNVSKSILINSNFSYKG